MSDRDASLSKDTRAISTSFSVKLVVAIVVGALLMSFLFPVAIGEMAGDSERTITQDTGENVSVFQDVNANLTGTTAGTSATYELEENGTTESNTISVGSETTYTSLPDGDVTVNVSEANAGNATATFSWDTTRGWGSGASSLWVVIPIMIVLAGALYLIGVARSV